MNEYGEFALGVEALTTSYRDGVHTVSEVIERCLQRIAEFDRNGPCLNAMITVNEEARERARQLDERSGAGLTVLHGVPLVIKDNINVGSLPTTGGCAALADLRPASSAPVVEKLQAAGAVVIGKSSMSEFAWGTYDTQNSIIDGYTRNPYHLEYGSGGSSGGTGVAIAAGYCTAGLGTDTGCSVRAPASINNLVGLRPTHGLIDMRGVMPMNADWDTVGPMALTVSDLSIVLDVLLDETAYGGCGRYQRAATEPPGREMRVGIVRQLAEPHDCDAGIVRCLNAAAADFESSGVVVVDPVESEVFGTAIDIEDWYLRFRFDLDGYLHEMEGCSPVTSLEEILQTGVVCERYLKPLQTSLAWPHRPEHHPRRAEMEAIRSRFREALLATFRRHDLDALAFPTFRYPPVRNGELRGDRPGADAPVGSNNYFASLTGYPALSVPMGFVDPGLPIGLQLLGGPGTEDRLIQLAAAYEKQTRHRLEPGFQAGG